MPTARFGGRGLNTISASFSQRKKHAVLKGETLRDEPHDGSLIIISFPNELELEVIAIGRRDPGRTAGFTCEP